MIAIDLGSNTIRVVKIDCKTKKRVSEYEKIVRTAQNLHIDGTIDSKTVDNIIKAIEESKKVVSYNQDDKIEAVTTEALRVAKNSKDVLNTICDKTGISFSIIDGNTEANLVLVAIKNSIKELSIDTNNFVIVDIGGGSTEVTFYNSGKITSNSFKVGIVTLTNISLNKELSQIRDITKDKLKDIKKFVDNYYKNHSVEYFISTAGTPTTISAIKHGMCYSTYDYRVVNGSNIYTDDLENTLQHLFSLSKDEKEALVGINRDDLIITGIIILQEIFNILRFDSSIVIDDGLREGVAIQMCKKDTN
jgi:exopolyphosphatase/guanosine-5'-triphosphate,3'-diphosphate pyrophosphatase